MTIIFILISVIIIGLLTACFLLYTSVKKTENNHSEILMLNLKKVNNLVNVQGEFTEVFKHNNKNDYFFNLIKSEKRALVFIKSKVLMGFNFDKLKFELNNNAKTITLSKKPLIEILNLDIQIEYFDIKNGSINKFTKEELNDIKELAHKFMVEKIYDSDLPRFAWDQGNEGLSLIEENAKTLGWKLIKTF